MTAEPHCLCEQCKMTVLQCKERSAKESSDKMPVVGVDYIIQKLGQEYDDGGYNPDIPLWVQVKSDLKKLRTKEREQG